MKDLTNSNIDRKNILNNNIALKRIYEYVGFEGIFFNEEYRYSKTMVANFLELKNVQLTDTLRILKQKPLNKKLKNLKKWKEKNKWLALN